MKKAPKIIKILIILLLLAAGGGAYYYSHRGEVTTDNAAIEAHTISISPKVQGYVKALYITDNQEVKAGDILLEIDQTDYIIRRDKAKATLAAAQAAANASQSNVTTTTVSAPSN